jgi:hypothetical protein
MAISTSCSNCGRVVYASHNEAGLAKPCPGCGYSIPIPADSSAAVEKPAIKDCPQCGSKLRLVRQLHGKNVRCNRCGVVLTVSADPWRLSMVNGASVPAAGGEFMEPEYFLGSDASPSPAPKTDGHESPLSRIPAGMTPLTKAVASRAQTGDSLSFLSDSTVRDIGVNSTNSYKTCDSPNASIAMPKKPFGLVWIVFYWAISSIFAIIGGLFLLYAASFTGSMITTFGKETFSEMQGGLIRLLFVEFLGVLVFHFGLLTMVACYGLWTMRKWGLKLAKQLSVVYAILNLLTFTFAIVTRVGIIANLAGFIVSVVITIYLYGGSELSERLQQAYSRLGGADEQKWDGYK